MFGSRLMPCGRCGAWGQRDGMCLGCGAISGYAVVPLDQCAGDGRWIHVFSGSPQDIEGSLSRAADLPGDEGAARLSVARRLVQRLSAPTVTVFLDLRPGQAGHVTRAGRRGRTAESVRMETFFELPWLIVRSEAGEARVVRRLHQRVRKTFGAGAVTTDSTQFFLDSLWLNLGGRVLRSTCAGPARLLTVPLEVSGPTAPGWGSSLRPTAPGAPLAEASLTSGLLVAFLLLVALPAVLIGVAQPVDGVVPSAGLDVPPLSARVVRRTLRHPDTWSQRKALVASESLGAKERWRLLRQMAVDPRWNLHTRLQAVDLLSREGSLGASTLLAVEAALATDLSRWRSEGSPGMEVVRGETTEVRRTALLALAQRTDDVRVHRVAQRRAQDPQEHLLIRRAAVTVLSGRREPEVLEALHDVLRVSSDPILQGKAGYALARMAPGRAVAPLRRLALRLLQRPPTQDEGAALLATVRGLSAAGDEPFLSGLLERPETPLSVRRELERLTGP